MKVNCLLLAILLYTLITGILTYPLFFNMDKGVFGYKGDNMNQMHDIWFAKINLLSKIGFENPTIIDTVEHSKVVTQPILDLILLVLAVPTNPLIAYNILILFSFISSAFIMYILSYKITNNRWGAFISGILFSFSTYHYTQAQSHLEIAQIELLPLCGLTLVNYLKKPTLKALTILAVANSLTILTVNYYGYFMVLLTFLTLIYLTIKRTKNISKHLFISILILTASVGVFGLKYINTVKTIPDLETLTWKRMQRRESDFFTYSARPWFYVLPDVRNPITGKLSQNILRKIAKREPYFLTQTFFENEHSLYLGLGTILLCIYAFVKRKEKDKKIIYSLIAFSVFFLILSAPPYATISSHKIYFPSFFLSKIIPQFRVYARAGIIALAFLSIVSSFGIKYLLEKKKSNQLKLILTILISLFILVDTFKKVEFTKLLPIPQYYNIIKNANVAEVIEFPKPVDARHLFYQMYHHKTVYGLEDISKIEAVIEEAKKPVFVVYRKDSGKIYENLINNEKGSELNQTTPLEQSPTIKEELPDINIKNGTIVFGTLDVVLYKVD